MGSEPSSRAGLLDDPNRYEWMPAWTPPDVSGGLVPLCVDCLVNPRERGTDAGQRCKFCDRKRARRLRR